MGEDGASQVGGDGHSAVGTFGRPPRHLRHQRQLRRPSRSPDPQMPMLKELMIRSIDRCDQSAIETKRKSSSTLPDETGKATCCWTDDDDDADTDDDDDGDDYDDDYDEVVGNSAVFVISRLCVILRYGNWAVCHS